MASSEWHWKHGAKYAAEGIKTALLLNGAPAIALMTFSLSRGQLKSDNQQRCAAEHRISLRPSPNSPFGRMATHRCR
jgi:hypothetical protein